MSEVVGYSTLEVIPSLKGLRAQLEKQASGDFAAAGKKGGAKYGDAAGREAADGFKSRVSRGLKGFNPLAGLAVGAGAFTLFKSAIEGASDLSESTSKVNIVFGEASEAVLAFGANASASLGQSEAQALSAAGTFGNLLRSVGLAEDDAAKFSTTMVALASDLASFNNTDVDTALTALRSGLVGETEPLKAFGVNMNEAVLKAKALELGLSDGKGVLDANAKAQAAYAVILEQTTLAQGDFTRTAGGLANQSKTLKAQWSEMTTELGQELLPATTAFVSFMNSEGLPALSAAGGFAKDAAVAFAELPAPVQAAAAAFVALKVASAVGVTDGLSRGVSFTSRAMDDLRLRTMLATDAYHSQRSASITLTGAQAGVSLGAGRVVAGMTAIRTASIGAAAGLRAVGASAVAALGGPFGIAVIGATVALTAFMSRQKDAKEEIGGLTESLNEQTGALTDNTRSLVAKALEDKNLLRGAEFLSLSLSTVTDAALGNSDAMADLRAEHGRLVDQLKSGTISDSEFRLAAGALGGLIDGVREVSDETAGAREEALRLAAANRDSAASNGTAAGSFRDLKSEIKSTRTDLQKLLETEEERAQNAIQSRRDQLGLITTLQAARKEANEGRKTLNKHTEAGQENMAALLDLADQWSTSTPKVQNARGAYEQMRGEFVQVARSMGATKGEAQKLADELLKVPKTAPLKFQSEGYQKTIRELRALREEAASLRELTLFTFTTAGNAQRNPDQDRFASGGMIGGYGSGTSDSNLIWASRGEFMQRKAAVDYYGPEFMRRLNALQIPKFPGYAQGGLISGDRPSAPAAGVSVTIGQVVAHDYADFMHQAQRRAQRAQMDGVRM